MAEIAVRDIQVGEMTLRVAEAGAGPLVLLLHGFPECWYSWRHQLVALAEAGFHAVAPNQRGYPGSTAPAEVGDYTLPHLVGDVVGLLAALGARTATVIGHDWGAPVAWHTALLRPDLIRGVAGLSVPITPRGPKPPLTAAAQRFGANFYQLHFQRLGVERDFEADLAGTFRRTLYGISGDYPELWSLTVDDGERFVDSWADPVELPDWLTEADIARYVGEFAGASFAGPLNWYRNIDRNWALTAPWDGARIPAPALFLGGERDPLIATFDTGKLPDLLRTRLADLREVRLYPGAGHWIQQERPAEVNAALVEFARLTAPDSSEIPAQPRATEQHRAAPGITGGQ